MVGDSYFPPTSPGAQPSTTPGLEFWEAAEELPLLLPDVQNLQEKEQCPMAGKEALINPAVPWDRGHAEADEWETVGPQVLTNPIPGTHTSCICASL